MGGKIGWRSTKEKVHAFWFTPCINHFILYLCARFTLETQPSCNRIPTPGKLDKLSDIDRIKYFPLSERLIAIRHNRHISAFQRGLDIEFQQRLITLVYQMSASVFQTPYSDYFLISARLPDTTDGYVVHYDGMLNLAFSRIFIGYCFSVFTMV